MEALVCELKGVGRKPGKQYRFINQGAEKCRRAAQGT